MSDSFADMLQAKILGRNQTNNEFAKGIKGVTKKDLDSILAGIAPSKYILGKICEALDWDYDPEPQSKNIQLPTQKIIKADFKNKKPRSPLKAKGRFCIRCWFREQIYVYDTIELAHYTGQMQGALGKGRGELVSNILKCPLCKPCHKRFDEPKEHKSTELSEEFLFLIALFISQEFEAGNIIIKSKT